MLRAAFDYLLPKVCHLCGLKLAPHEEFVCTVCLEQLPRTHYWKMPLNGMEQRFAGLVRFSRAAGHFFYSRNSDTARLVHDFKYHGYPDLARRMGRLMGEELLHVGFLSHADAIVPVPSHWTKRLARGYNQVDCLAQGMADATGLPVAKVMAARRGHRAQASLGTEQRRHNLDGIFRLSDPGVIKGASVVLVDDVCTTGTTMLQAAQTLWREGDPGGLMLLSLAVTT